MIIEDDNCRNCGKFDQDDLVVRSTATLKGGIKRRYMWCEACDDADRENRGLPPRKKPDDFAEAWKRAAAESRIRIAMQTSGLNYVN
jgi:hypothetical protein